MIPIAFDRSLMLPIVFLAIAVMLTVSGELLLKHGMNRSGVMDLAPASFLPTLICVYTNPFVVLGFLFILSASVFWLSVISRVPLSYAYPMLGTSYILVVIAS